MAHPISNLRLQYFLNPAVAPTALYSDAQKQILGGEAFTQAEAQIVQWPGYAPTPLRELSGLAKEVGVAKMYYKDEADRSGLNSF